MKEVAEFGRLADDRKDGLIRMEKLSKMIPMALYSFVGMVSLAMALKGLFANRFLPFQEKAAGRRWNEIDASLRPLMLFFLRISGLGFLMVSILLLVCPVVNYFIPNGFFKYAAPGIALIFCSGLFFINYSLRQSTKADTPWKGSLFAMAAVSAGILLSVFN
jgi:hypothetical protein